MSNASFSFILIVANFRNVGIFCCGYVFAGVSALSFLKFVFFVIKTPLELCIFLKLS